MRQVHRRLTALLLALLLALYPASATTLDIIGMETANLIEFQTSGCAIESSTIRSGAYSVFCDQSSTYSYTETFTASTEVYVRFYIYPVGGTSGTLQSFVVGRNGTTALWGIGFTSGASPTVTIYIGGTGTGTGTYTILAYNLIEVRAKHGTGSNGILEVKLNGTTEISISTATFTSITNNIGFGTWDTGGSRDSYFDDIVINDTGYVGAGRVNSLRPNADGDEGTSSGWTNNWDAINDLPITESAGSERTENGVTSFLDNLTASSTFDETPGTINGGKVLIRALRSSGSGRTHHIRSKKSGGSAENSGDLGLNTSYLTYYWVPTTQPASSSELDSWQLGCAQSATGGRQMSCSEVFFMVDYAPSVGGSGQSPQFFISAQ